MLEAAGAGGMGEVYKARDTRLDRFVAIKILPEHLSDHSELRQRFEREARAISKLSHPNICALYDIGQEKDIDYLVMEYLEGETLFERLSRGAIPLPEAIDLAIQIAEALDSAHQQGFLHRDLKPGNVMLTQSGAKLLDFGLAKHAVSAPGVVLTESPTMTSPITVDGAIVGTYQYLAPELLEGGEASRQSDVFSFGATLYEMVTRISAFAGKTQASVIAGILKGEPAPVSTVMPEAPQRLDRLIRECLAKNPVERRQSMHDIVLELKGIVDRFGHEDVDSAPPPAGRQREKSAWCIAGLFGLLAFALTAVLLLQKEADLQVIRAEIPPPEGTTFAFAGTTPCPVIISPDGRTIVFGAINEEGAKFLWTRPIDSARAHLLPDTENAVYPFWSADSRSVAFFVGDRLKKISLDGLMTRTICNARNGKGGNWNSAGVILFAPSHDTGIHTVSAGGGEPKPVTVLDTSTTVDSHRFPQFLPDGDHFIFVARHSGSTSADRTNAIMLGSLTDGSVRELTKTDSQGRYESGHLLYLLDQNLQAKPFDPQALQFTGDAIPIVQNVDLYPGAVYGFYAVSENGYLVYRRDGGAPGELVLFERGGEPIGTLGEPADYRNPKFSPNGEHVAVEILDPDLGTADLWIFDVARNIRTRFTFDPGQDHGAAWSPDGTEIAYASIRGDRHQLYRKPAFSTGEVKLIYDTSRGIGPSDWSPDGEWIAFTMENDLWIVRASGGEEPVQITSTESYETKMVFSPDGNWISYTSDESGRSQIYATSFPETGRKWQVSPEFGYAGGWISGGSEIAFANGIQLTLDAVPVEIVGSSLRIGNPHVIFDVTGCTSGDMMLDGKLGILCRQSGIKAKSPLVLVVNWTEELPER